MSLDPAAPADYLVGHIEDALARDERVCEQGLHVAVRDGVVTVSGVVSTEERQQRIPEVVHELLAGFEIRDKTTVSQYPEDARVERVEVEHGSPEGRS